MGENCVAVTGISMVVLMTITVFGLSVATWIRLDDSYNQGAKNGDPDNDYKQPWFALLFLSVFSIAGVIIQGLFMSQTDDGESKHNWFTRLLQLVPLAMWIWLLVMYSDDAGFDWSDFRDHYPELGDIAEIWIWFITGLYSLITLVAIITCVGMSVAR